MSTAVEPLLERAGELAAVEALLAGARAGRGRALVLEAPPGLGKSALAARAAAVAAGEGFLVLRASGHELERGLGWGVARSLFEPWLLARPGGERAELLDGPAASSRPLFEPVAGDAADPFGILHGLYWLAVRIAELGPLLLVIDDAHWADEPSLRFLLYLLGRLEEHPIAVLAAVRPGQGGLAEQLAARPASAVRELAPLGAAAVTDLVRRRFERADERCCVRCFELTRGNPLHVRELLAAIAQDGGADLRAAADRAARSLSRSVLLRLSQLSAGAQALARAVAVFEGDVPLHLAAALATVDPVTALAAADELARADIVGAGDPLAFVHPLMRAAVYESLAQPERALTHREAARLLAEHGAPSEQIGGHLLEAPPAGDGLVVEGLRAAARDALAHGVPDAAARYLERAWREPPPPAARPDVLAELGRAELAAGRPGAATHLEAAIRLHTDARRRAALCLELGRTLHDFGRLEAACEAFERGASELGDDAPTELSLELEAWYLTSAMLLPDRAAGARTRIDAILEIAPATRAERTLASKALIMRVYSGGTRDELTALARRALAGERLLEEDGVESQAACHVAAALSYCDEFAAAEDLLDRVHALARRRGQVTWVAAAAQLRARQRLWTGPIPEAVADARLAYDIFSGGLQMYLPATVYCLACGLIERDAPDEADAVLAVLDAERPGGLFGAWRHEALGRLAAYRGQHEAALEAQLAAGELLRPLTVTNPAMFPWRSQAALAALRLGRREQARELIAGELALAERFGAARAIGVARRAAGLLERGEDAVAALRSAAELLERCGARVEQAHALVELGGAVRRAGRPGEARDVLRRAIALADELGACALARRGRDELTRAGGRAPKAGVTDELTPSERRVAQLAAAGRTNREIANELFVTVKAVEWHLGNVYRKLGVRGRGQLGPAL